MNSISSSVLSEFKTALQKLFSLDRFLIPSMLIVVSGIVTGWVVPRIMDRYTERKLEFELRAALIDDLFQEPAAFKTNLVTYCQTTSNYWREGTRIVAWRTCLETKRRAGLMKEPRVSDERNLLQRKHEDIDDMLQKYYDSRQEHREHFDIWLSTVRARLRVHIGDVTGVEEAISAFETEADKLDQQVDDFSSKRQDVAEAVIEGTKTATPPSGSLASIELTEEWCRSLEQSAEKGFDSQEIPRLHFEDFDRAAEQLVLIVESSRMRVSR